jgi:6-pyruvoyltetrahydropterin/6-carboxytetrahydropterin synthase
MDRNMFELRVTTRFAAAHQLKMAAQKCENLHGHNWKVEVYVSGADLDPGGMLVDFGVVKKHVARIMDRLDHKFLNELDFFSHGNPSSENIARYIARSLAAEMQIPGVRVSRVTAWESEDASATYLMPA